MISLLCSNTSLPWKSGTRSSKVPSGRTGFWSVIPCCSPSRKSSSPKASAVWTRPVPSSVVTKSRGQDRVAQRAEVLALDEAEGRLVAGPLERSAGEGGELGPALAEYSVRQRPRDHDDLVGAGGLGAHVLDLGTGGDGRV